MWFCLDLGQCFGGSGQQDEINEIKPYMEGREISLVMRGQKGGGRPAKVCTAREMQCGSHRREQRSWWRVQDMFIKKQSLVKLQWRAGGESEMAARHRGSPTRNKMKTFPQNSARCFWQSCWLVSAGVHDTVWGVYILPWIQFGRGKCCQSEWLFILDGLQETEKGGVFTTFCCNSQDGRVRERDSLEKSEFWTLLQIQKAQTVYVQ